MHERAITDSLIDELREVTGAHERSIYRRVLGLPVRGGVGRAIDRELAKRGLITTHQQPHRAA